MNVNFRSKDWRYRRLEQRTKFFFFAVEFFRGPAMVLAFELEIFEKDPPDLALSCKECVHLDLDRVPGRVHLVLDLGQLRLEKTRNICVKIWLFCHAKTGLIATTTMVFSSS